MDSRKLSCRQVPNTLRCWVLSLVDIAVKMHIKVIRKKITPFSYESNLSFTLILKNDRFSISFSLSVKNSFQGAGPLTDILYFDLFN